MKFFWLLFFIVLVNIPLWSSFAASDQQIVTWLFDQWLSKYSNVNEFRPQSHVSRGEAAKFMVEFAKLWKKSKIKNTEECRFTDISNYDSSLMPSIIEACEYWIFKWFQGKFYPKNAISKAEALAVVMRMAYGVLDEVNDYPWFNSYHNKATQLGIRNVEYIMRGWSNYEAAITRMHIATWIHELFLAQSTVLGIWDGNQNVYDLDQADKVLHGVALSCENAMQDENTIITYECNDVAQYADIIAFLDDLKQWRYQDAANLMNQSSMIPVIISSINQPVYFMPYEKWIIGFFISWNWDTNYSMLYITVSNNKLYLYRSKNTMLLRYNTNNSPISFNWIDLIKLNWSIELPIKNAYYPKWVQDCNRDQLNECVNNHLKSVMQWKTIDIDTTERINAMKNKIRK